MVPWSARWESRGTKSKAVTLPRANIALKKPNRTTQNLDRHPTGIPPIDLERASLFPELPTRSSSGAATSWIVKIKKK
ncbi:hypothetical protein SCOR_32265 [Sulfidibacter corallicola]